MKVVLDTNVFISGIFWKGESHTIIQAWKDGWVALVSSPALLSEMVRVLNDFKIRMEPSLIKEWKEMVLQNSLMVEPSERISVAEDHDDDAFIEAAVAGGAAYIVSQDTHLLKIGRYRGVRIVSPAEFIRILQSR